VVAYHLVIVILVLYSISEESQLQPLDKFAESRFKKVIFTYEHFDFKRVSWDERWLPNSRLILDAG